LKKAITKQFLKRNSASSSNIAQWKGQDIILFQEDLQKTVKSTISEKSFYSYFKNSDQKLPRIDVLNLLSQYCDYTNWNDFKTTHTNTKKVIPEARNFKWVWVIIVCLCLTAVLFLAIPIKHHYKFCFIDQDRNSPITQTPIGITILNNKESPFYIKSDASGCFEWETKDDFIHFVVQSPYHKTDTIYRVISDRKSELLPIRTNDYALALYYYANGNIKDWKNRRKELSEMISEKATIFQILPQGLGIEMYSKSKFINTLTTPTKSLKGIEIISSQRSNGQLVKIKFKIKS